MESFIYDEKILLNVIFKSHPYFASFKPELPYEYIKKYSQKNDLILDPFCGSGVTLLVSKLNYRNSVGVDVNPLACLISKVRITNLTIEEYNEINDCVKNIENNLNVVYGQTNLTNDNFISLDPLIPNFLNRDYWFNENSLKELGIIKAHINLINNEKIKNFCLVAFSSIIVKASNQHHETRYKRIDKQIEKNYVFKLYKKKIVEMINGQKKLYDNYNFINNCDVIYDDFRFTNKIEKNSIDLIITSPPYLNAWDYNLYQRFRMLWLDFDNLEYKNREIGSHLKHYNINEPLKKYLNDMNLSIKNMYAFLKPNKYCVIVIGNSVIKGQRVDIGEEIIKLSINNDFTFIEVKKQNIFGPHFSQKRSYEQKIENIIILKKLK